MRKVLSHISGSFHLGIPHLLHQGQQVSQLGKHLVKGRFLKSRQAHGLLHPQDVMLRVGLVEATKGDC